MYKRKRVNKVRECKTIPACTCTLIDKIDRSNWM